MSIKRLNLVKMKPQRTIVRLPKTIALVVVAVAILWTSLPVFASVEQMGSIGIGTPNCSSLTLQGELEAGAVFQSLIPGPLANWRVNLRQVQSFKASSPALWPIGVSASQATACGK